MQTISKALLVLSALLVFSAPARAETISIVADEWCPYNCAPDSDKPGVFIEIARYAFEKEGYVLDYKIIPWARAIEDTREGKHTAITGASHGDAPDFIFPEIPQATSVMTFYVKAGNPWVYEGLESLKKISLGTIDSYSYGASIDPYIQANLENMRNIQVLSGDSALENNVSKLLKGRIHATIESADVMDYYLAQNGLSDKVVKAGHLPLTEDQNLYIAFSPKNPNSKKYAKILSDTMERLKETGRLEEILSHYGLSTAATPPEQTPTPGQP